MKEFFAMGGYAFYVWLSYGLAALVMIWNLWMLRKQRQRILEEIDELHTEDEGGS